MTISHRASSGLSAGTTTTGGSFTLPTGHTTDDLLLAWLGVKAYTVGIASGTLTTDYTARGNITSGTVVNGVGVGSTRSWAYSRTHTGTESAPACTLDAAPSPSMKSMSAYSKTVAGAWDIATATGADTNAAGSGLSIVSGTIALKPGDVLLVHVVGPDDTAIPVTPAVSATGITFGTPVQRLTTTGTTSGNDGVQTVWEIPVTAGTGTVAVTFSSTLTNSGESEAAANFIRLREPAVAFNPATETDTAQPFGRRKARTPGITTETDAAQTLGRRKQRAVGVNTETDAAQALGKVKYRALGVAVETDSGVTLGKVKQRAVTLATETDASQALGRFKQLPLGPATDTQTALPAIRRVPQVFALGTATETDASQALGRTKIKAVSPATETDLSLTLGKVKYRSVSNASETDAAQALAKSKRRAVTLVTETDAAQAITRLLGPEPAVLLEQVKQVTAGSTITFTMPAYALADGVVAIHTSRSSNANTASISDNAGLGSIWTEQTPAGGVAANSSSRHYVWTTPWIAALAGKVVTITWTGANNSGASCHVVEGVEIDTFAYATGASGSSVNLPSSTATGINPFVLAMLGGRGNADGSQYTLDSGGALGDYGYPLATSSIAATPTRNAYAGAVRLEQASATITAFSLPLTGSVNSRFTAQLAMLPTGVSNPGGSPTYIAVGTALETDAAQALGRSGPRTADPALETDIALPIGKRKFRSLGIAIEGDTAMAVGRPAVGSGLKYSRPDTTGWTVRNITTSGGTIVLTNGVDYILNSPRLGSGALATITGAVAVRGGRDVSWIGAKFGGRTSVPTGAYDSTNRGIRLGGFNAGEDGSDVRSVYFEGFWFLPGTYLSDSIQIANIYTNNMTVTIQNVRVDSINYGDEPGVHADTFQIVGGPKNLFIYNWTSKNCGYQGFYMDPQDTRNSGAVPSGSGKVPWEISNVNLEDTDISGGARYMWCDRRVSWTQIKASKVYITPTSRNSFDSFGAADPAEVTLGFSPTGDFVPASLWATGEYVSGDTGRSDPQFYYVTESDEAQPISRTKRKALGVAVDVSTSITVRPGKRRSITFAEEFDEAQPFRSRITVALGTAEELDVALTVATPQYLVRLVNTSVGNFHDVARPPGHPSVAGGRWVGLWPRLVMPATQKALLLWEDGTVKEIAGWSSVAEMESADELIAGGTKWVGLNTSWQAAALAAAGYTLVRADESEV